MECIRVDKVGVSRMCFIADPRLSSRVSANSCLAIEPRLFSIFSFLSSLLKTILPLFNRLMAYPLIWRPVYMLTTNIVFSVGLVQKLVRSHFTFTFSTARIIA